MAKKNQNVLAINVVGLGVTYGATGRLTVEQLQHVHAVEKRPLADIRNDFVAGLLMDALYRGMADGEALIQARKLMAMAGAGSKAEVKRDADQERAVNTAARAWSHVASKAGLRASKRGRKAGTKVAKGEAATKGEKPASEAPKAGKLEAPRVTSFGEAQKHIRNMALMLSSFCAKNAEVLDGEPKGAKLSKIIAKLVKDVNTLT